MLLYSYTDHKESTGLYIVAVTELTRRATNQCLLITPGARELQCCWKRINTVKCNSGLLPCSGGSKYVHSEPEWAYSTPALFSRHCRTCDNICWKKGVSYIWIPRLFKFTCLYIVSLNNKTAKDSTALVWFNLVVVVSCPGFISMSYLQWNCILELKWSEQSWSYIFCYITILTL